MASTGLDEKFKMEKQQISNLIGQRFGSLTVIKKSDKMAKSGSMWDCICDCGKQKTIARSSLVSGHTKSCGCSRYGKQNGMSKERLYNIWRKMHVRCENPRHDHFDRYGGRGIKVCKEWDSFLVFREWAVNNGYAENLTIDRINGDGDYEPENCRWITQKEQMQNICTNRIILFDGERYTVPQFAEMLKVPQYTVRNQLRSGWSPEKIASNAGFHNE